MMSFTGKNQKKKIEHGLHRCYGFTLICENQLNPRYPCSNFINDDVQKNHCCPTKRIVIPKHVDNIASPDKSGQALRDFFGSGVIFNSTNILPRWGCPFRDKILVDNILRKRHKSLRDEIRNFTDSIAKKCK